LEPLITELIQNGLIQHHVDCVLRNGMMFRCKLDWDLGWSWGSISSILSCEKLANSQNWSCHL